MSKLSDPEYLLTEQYHDASNLNARINLHVGFSINKYDWFLWIFDHFDLPPRCRILELGCGPGDLWLKNNHRIPAGWEITLSDFSAGMLEQARQNLHACPHPFTFDIIDAQSIPFEDHSLDAVIANHMLYHVPDRAKALSEIRRALKTEGRLYATTVGEKHLHELPDLIARFDPDLAVDRLDEANEFTLESGGAQLARWFSQVTLRRYQDDLHITAAAPLVDYVMSSKRMGFWLTEDRRDSFTSFIQQELASNDGVIHITKDSGIFEAAA